MFKKLKNILGLCVPIGLALFLIGSILNKYQIISDYSKGFLHGLSAVFMIVGLIYIVSMRTNIRGLFWYSKK